MKLMRKAVGSLGGIFLAALLIGALAPKATHGIVAALVQVTNTTANPASTLDADHATRIPYASTQYPFCGGGGLTNCEISSFTPAPAGYRLVVENVSVVAPLTSGAASLPYGFVFNQISGAVFAVSGVIAEDHNAVIGQSVHAYFDPTDLSPEVLIYGSFNGGAATVTLNGYLINCSVAPCPPIQH
jgi:hypothetical protein